MDLSFHVLDVFIKSLHFWINSNRLLGVNIDYKILPIISSCVFHVSLSEM
jgi:hypothetical protein